MRRLGSELETSFCQIWMSMFILVNSFEIIQGRTWQSIQGLMKEAKHQIHTLENCVLSTVKARRQIWL